GGPPGHYWRFPTKSDAIPALGKPGDTGTNLASFLAVLKRSGAAGPGLLSYLFPGYTLALDIPNAGDDLRRLHDRLERILLELGGRIYFAKDTLGTGEAIAAMYPRLEEFRAVQAELDPAGRIRSRLASRLSLLQDR
ncbi:MAG: hypothetical protein EBZ59_08280, partial [Planctomycetia bacterium]|nr:hypothetical protein [Planctomycetia bacterium]